MTARSNFEWNMDTDLERKFARFGDGLEVRDGTMICGYASLFGDVDQGNDIVEAGAYAASLQDTQSKWCPSKNAMATRRDTAHRNLG